MVRNRRDEPGWWDDLPPRIRERFALPEREESGPPVAVAAPPRRSLAWLRDSSIFALIMLGVALANLFFLLLVFALVDSPAPSR
ncbi:MAG: hypothetical protein U0791_27130 [Gemmataceae bacterium]